MDWHELSANWDSMFGRLKRRFPGIARARLSEAPRDRRVLTHHIADMHELTLHEARDALEEFMDREDLARRASELESR